MHQPKNQLGEVLVLGLAVSCVRGEMKLSIQLVSYFAFFTRQAQKNSSLGSSSSLGATGNMAEDDDSEAGYYSTYTTQTLFYPSQFAEASSSKFGLALDGSSGFTKASSTPAPAAGNSVPQAVGTKRK
ncbi:hypothetical protein C8J56DRAFT_888659 [Mycena floridula]|nr:hypothetical protein C8J56DRAFT_888659 [Mycena floridula]